MEHSLGAVRAEDFMWFIITDIQLTLSKANSFL